MRPGRDVLERNLELLFTRAWRPVRAQPAFRAALRERFCDLAVARRVPLRSRASLRLALAAAALLVAALGWILGGPGRGTARLEPADILAAGDVAWRAGQAAWQAASPPADLGLRRFARNLEGHCHLSAWDRRRRWLRRL